ncbi:MAG: VapC toxin family PIN domain ribonuclease [Acidobacteria bacterium]|nr:MAG: VapC toxin family PIN domain ribonuclease [Acidobacteriota bacterium]
MRRFLIDTSGYSAFKRGAAEVIAAVEDADEVYLNATVFGELLGGFKRSRRQAANLAALREFVESPRVNIVEIDEETAERYADIYNGLRAAGALIPTNDMWIAASAMQHGLPLLTLDGHFERIPQIVTVPLSER